jgi:predicted MFS family arabinose efflux permease
MRICRSTTPGSSQAMTGTLAIGCAVAVANVYYAQPLSAVIAAAIGLPVRSAGLVIALTQAGYGLGLLLIVPLADVIENRRLICGGLCLSGLGLFAVARASSSTLLLTASFIVGVTTTVVQVMVPFASHFAPLRSRGKVTGQIMSGLLLGILLARPIASFITANWGWRAVFTISAASILFLAYLLWRQLPQRLPTRIDDGGSILASMWALVRRTPVLRQRALLQGFLFAAFNVFWTGSPLLLARHYGMTFHGIALFSLVGAGGVLIAPVAGRMADLGLTKAGTGFSLIAALMALDLAAWADNHKSVALLAAAGLCLDAAIQMCLVLSLRSIYMLEPSERGRLNGLFMAWMFGCGAAASIASVVIFDSGGWSLLMNFGVGLLVTCLLLFSWTLRPVCHAN